MEPKIVIAVMGDGGVGKTALAMQFCLNEFPTNPSPTIIDTYQKKVKVDNEDELLEILDTAGQEEYRGMQNEWIEKADGFVLVYSITSRQSFNYMRDLMGDMERNHPLSIFKPRCIVGNKNDHYRERQVSSEEGIALAKQLGCTFCETSAKSKFNVENAFHSIVRQLRKAKKDGKKTQKCVIL